MKHWLLLISIILFSSGVDAQVKKNYSDSMQSYRYHYISTHELVRKEDQQFLQFFPIDSSYHVVCRFEKIHDGKWFQMNASGNQKQTYRKFGKIYFTIHDTALVLYVYQSQSLLNNIEYEDYLFIPFTDPTNGPETYGGGRYMECFINEIKANQLVLDFNKAYNPYCAYREGYNCPLPPKENDLVAFIRAGEKNFTKPLH